MAKRAEREQSDSAARRERDTIVSQPGFAPAELEAAPTPHVELPPDVTPPIPLANLSRTVGSYVLLDEIGRGGAGVVYRAWQLSLKRVVALKMILTGTHSRADMRARFRAEAELAAQIHHPNVVQIYEIGEQDDLPYFSLEYLEGGTLSRKIDGVPLPPREAARIVRDIAYGVSAAHEQGLVHRDLKPANILMTPGGIPKITDFGLAKNLDAQGHTISGTILGTPSYMSPEQAKGNPHVAPATDIYSMGAMLYEMLTGKPPFRGETVVDTLEQVRTEMPTPPSQRNSEVPRDLELICLTCLRKDPSQRYPSAQALADDLQAFLVGDPIAARAESWHERMRRVVQESPLTLFIIAAGGCAAIGVSVGVWLSDPLLSGLCAAAGAVLGGSFFYARLRARLHDSHEGQRAAERTVERMHFVLERIAQLVATRHLDTILRLLAETARYLVNAQHATVYLVDHERRELWSQALLDECLKEIRLPLGNGIAGTVAATGETINLPDAYDDPRFNREFDARTGKRTRSLLTVAMKGTDGRVIGVFQLMNKRTGAFTRDDIALLSWLKEAALVAIQNASQDAQAAEEPPTIRTAADP